jgi:hypothetical protein
MASADLSVLDLDQTLGLPLQKNCVEAEGVADPDRPEWSSLRGLSAGLSLTSGTGWTPANTLQHDLSKLIFGLLCCLRCAILQFHAALRIADHLHRS